MVAPGAGFHGGTLYRPKNKWRPKNKVFAVKRIGFQSESMWWQNKKVFAYQSVGFRSQKEKKQKRMVSTQNGDTRGGPIAASLVHLNFFLSWN